MDLVMLQNRIGYNLWQKEKLSAHGIKLVYETCITEEATQDKEQPYR